MKAFWENITQATSSLKANKMRSFLTMLGIIIGIASVIAIMTLGDSLTGSISESMQSLGANNVTISLQSKNDGRSGTGMMALWRASGSAAIPEKNFITDEMLDELKAAFPDDIQAVSISNTIGSGTTASGKSYANLSLIGVDKDYAVANSITLTQGRFINERDEEGNKKTAVVSDHLAGNMFGNENPLGKQITITTDKHVGNYTIVGVYKYERTAMNMSTAAEKDISTDVYVPISLANKITGTSGYQSVTLLTSAAADTEAVTSSINSFFSRYYSRNPDYGINVLSMESMLDTITEMMNNVELAIAAIAAISLLVGGIGVMNIMLVSITERTREIGTRKAIGATNSEIRIQFIVEAVIICLIGGIIGITLGIMLGMFGASLLGTPVSISLGTVLGATAFSMAIGVFFGYYPANKAAKLDPIDALRYE